MKALGWTALALAAAMPMSLRAGSENVTHDQLTGLQAGAAIDRNCLEKNVLKDIGACRVAATAVQKTPPLMLGLYFHMWFSDVALAELYRDKKPDISALFEKLADAEFPAVIAYEADLHVEPADICGIVSVNCEAAQRFHDKWRNRPKP